MTVNRLVFIILVLSLLYCSFEIKIRDRILIELKINGDLSVKEPVDILNHSKQAIHAALNQLLESSMVEKFGRASKTIYRLKGESISEPNITNTLKGQEIDFLQHHFLQNTESGDILTGIEAFSHWCKQRQLPFMKTADEYIKTLKKYQKYQNKDGLISAWKNQRTPKVIMKST